MNKYILSLSLIAITLSTHAMDMDSATASYLQYIKDNRPTINKHATEECESYHVTLPSSHGVTESLECTLFYQSQTFSGNILGLHAPRIGINEDSVYIYPSYQQPLNKVDAKAWFLILKREYDNQSRTIKNGF